MSEEQAFLAAIAEDPDDDVPRLVFADWLTEHGHDDRAELIRVQCRLAGMAAGEPEAYDLRRRERELLDRHETQWRQALPSDATAGWQWGRFERGFAETVIVDDWSRFQPVAESVFDAQPVRRMILDSLPQGHASRLAECSSLSRLTALEMGRNRGGHDNADDIAFAPTLRGLRHFSARANGNGQRWVGSLLDHKAFPELRSLNLSLLRSIGRSSPRLFDTGHWQRLTHLDLGETDVGAQEFARMISDSPLLGCLESFDLRRCRIRGSEFVRLPLGKKSSALKSLRLTRNPLGDVGFAHLGRCDSFSRVEALDVSGCGVTSIPAETPSYWSSLVALNLADNALGDAGLAGLTGLPAPPRLRSLNLYSAQLTDVTTLAEWERLSGIQDLQLGIFGGTEANLMRLLRSERLRELRVLNLWHAGISDDTAEGLLGPALAGLCSLNLVGNPLTDRTAAAIAECELAADLRILEFQGASITDEGAAAILRSPHLNKLCQLRIDLDGLSADTIGKLRERFGAGLLF